VRRLSVRTAVRFNQQADRHPLDQMYGEIRHDLVAVIARVVICGS
jgi:hypothetical protein